MKSKYQINNGEGNPFSTLDQSLRLMATEIDEMPEGFGWGDGSSCDKGFRYKILADDVVLLGRIPQGRDYGKPGSPRRFSALVVYDQKPGEDQAPEWLTDILESVGEVVLPRTNANDSSLIIYS